MGLGLVRLLLGADGTTQFLHDLKLLNSYRPHDHA